VLNDDETIEITEHKTPEQALEEFRAQKDDPDAIASSFYKLLEKARPEVIALAEKQAGEALSAGHNIGRAFAAADKSPQQKQVFMRELQKLATKLSKQSQEVSDAHEASAKE